MKYIKNRYLVYLVINILAIFIFNALNNQLAITSSNYKSVNTVLSNTTQNTTPTLVYTSNNTSFETHNTLFFQHLSYIPLPDTRIIALSRFLKHYNSPLYPYASYIVKTADKYHQDWRVIVAISGVESAFGRITRPNSYNAWGWRGGPGGDFSNFKNWEHAIDYMTRRFTSGYGANPDPYSIYKTYCPPCTTAWPNGVSGYMKQLDYYRKQANKELLTKYSK